MATLMSGENVNFGNVPLKIQAID